MARLPDGSAVGALPSALSNRPIATYDVSGYARGAAAMAESVSDLGKGLLRAASGFEEIQSRAARARLDQAKANASYAIKTSEIRTALARESDPDAVATSYPEQFRQAFNDAGAQIGDPRMREAWGLARSVDRDGEIAASLDQSTVLRRRQEIQSVTAQLDTLRTLALDNDDEATRHDFIQAGHKLIAGLEDTGLIDEAGGRAMREGWTKSYARDRLGRLPPEERIKLLERGQGTVAEFIPGDERQTLIWTAQADAADAARKAQSDAALAQYITRNAIDDDLTRVAATGRGRDDVTPQQIDTALGPEARRAWQARRRDAFAVWQATHDFPVLTESEMMARIDMFAPTGESGSSTQGVESPDEMLVPADVRIVGDPPTEGFTGIIYPDPSPLLRSIDQKREFSISSYRGIGVVGWLRGDKPSTQYENGVLKRLVISNGTFAVVSPDSSDGLVKGMEITVSDDTFATILLNDKGDVEISYSRGRRI